MEPKKVKVKPNPERSVNGRPIQVEHPFHPQRKINTGGEEIQDCAYIQRRLRDKDLVLCKTVITVGDEHLHQPKSTEGHQPKKKGK